MRTLPAPTRRVSLLRVPRARSLLLAAVLAVLATVAAAAAHAYTDVLWFAELGSEDVYWTTLRWKVVAYGLAGVGTAGIVLANLVVAERITGARGRARGEKLPRAQRRLAYPVVAIAAGIASAKWQAPGTWAQLALWSGRSDFGVTDPLFHRDAGFFVFSLPLYQHVAAWLLASLAMAGAAVLAAHIGAGGIRRDGGLVVERGPRAHLLVLAAIALLVVSWCYRLDSYALAVPHDGAPGAGYTDAHVHVPALVVLAWLSVVGAGILLAAAAGRLKLLPTAVVVGLALLATAVPGLVSRPLERYVVQPQKLTRERPYLSAAITATRKAFALDRIASQDSAGSAQLTSDDLERNRATVDNVPLWDADVMRPALDELQSLGRYYSFPSTTLDRYGSQTMTVAARQLDLDGLGAEARGWANPRFAYTHGYGVAAVHATQTGANGHPSFAQTGFGRGANPLGLREPRVYFGERPAANPPYVVVASRRAEVDEPAPGSRAPAYHYDGPGGIRLSGLLRRSAFALRFGDLNLLLSQTVSARSRILLHRGAGERLRTLAPFVRWDGHPQTVVADGRVKFVFSGYTTSRSYPYSMPVELGGTRVNYARAAAHGVVDAFSGSVSLYAADAGDPILRAWRTVYPGLFLPAAQMPEQIRTHLRYPAALFDAQIEAYAAYHAAEPTAFANGSDAWQRALQLAGPVEKVGDVRFPMESKRDQIQPSHVFARLPGDAQERLMLVMPFTPRGRQNLVGYLSGSVDEQGRPQLSLLSLPRNRLTLGPSQVTRRILASPGVSRRLELSNRESNDLGKTSVDRTIVGAPRLLPIGDTLVQVQPIYLVAAGSGVPRLQLVTALANDRVGYGPDVETALRRTFEPSRSGAAQTR